MRSPASYVVENDCTLARATLFDMRMIIIRSYQVAQVEFLLFCNAIVWISFLYEPSSKGDTNRETTAPTYLVTPANNSCSFEFVLLPAI